MEVLVFLVPLALMLGLIGLMGFLWSLRTASTMILKGQGGERLPMMNPLDKPRLLELELLMSSVDDVGPNVESDRDDHD
jgi:hypothetical protein